MEDGIRVLGRDDLGAFLALAAEDPAVNVFVEHRARTTALDPRWLGGEVWGRFEGEALVAACHVAANLVPVGCDVDDARRFARFALRHGRRASTLVGEQELVATFWEELDGAWGPARDERWSQPHLEYVGPARVGLDPRVRRSALEDVEQLHPACVAMYTEEVGVSPEGPGGTEAYRARVVQLVSRGWSWARYDVDGRVEFKAEVACASPRAAQVQGVWVRPDLRGQGIATAGMAAVAEAVRRDVAPVVSLYVNEWNTAARAGDERVGFVETARFATVML